MTDLSTPGGVFFLVGDDEFRKERAARELVERHLDPATRDFNYDVLRGGEVEVETLASILATPPMMAEWRVVLVREAEGLAGSSRSRAVIEELLDNPPPGLAVILQTTIPEGSTAKFYKNLRKRARTQEFEAVPDQDVPRWLVDWTRDTHGVELEEDAARALAGAVGADLGVLAREVEKLVSVVEEGHAIDRAAVEAAGTRLPRQDRWEWMDTVGERRFKEALEGLAVLLDHGESGVGLTIGLTTHLLRLGVLASEGQEGLARALHPRFRSWLPRKLAPQARRWTSQELERALDGLLEVDRLLKSASFSDRHLLEQWLLKERVRAEGAA